MRQNPTDDELLRSYLLGELPGPEAERLEQRLLVEEDLFDLSEALEAELLASASRGELAPAERERVLRRLASSPEGRERLALARALNAIADEEAASVVVPFRRRETRPKPVFRWAALAAAGLLAVVGLFRSIQPPPQPTIEGVSQPPVITESSPPKNPVLSVPPETTPQAVAAPEPSPTPDQLVRKAPEPPVAKKPEPVKAVFALASMTLRSAGETEEFSLPSNAQVAEIQVDLEGVGDSGVFHATVRNEAQETIWQDRSLKAQRLSWGTALVLEIPAERLTPGRYEIDITMEGDSETMTQEFDIVQRDL